MKEKCSSTDTINYRFCKNFADLIRLIFTGLQMTAQFAGWRE